MNTITSSLSTALLALALTTASAQVIPNNNTSEFQKNLEAIADKPVTVILHQNNNGAKITVTNGAIVKVILESQAASTGFDWTQAFSSSEVLTLQNKYIKKASTDAMGAPCHEVWVFKATAPGQTFLNFSLVRSWEKEALPLQAAQFHITVE